MLLQQCGDNNDDKMNKCDPRGKILEKGWKEIEV
jgi:hypothetical protein